MALTNRLMLRQGQSLVMTPQLLQAIKLLQLSHLDLTSFVQEELDRNPLLERAEDIAPERNDAPAIDRFAATEERAASVESAKASEWERSDMPLEASAVGAELGADHSNSFESEPASPPVSDEAGLSESAWTGAPGSGSGSSGGESPNLEAYVAAKSSLPEFLADQVALALVDPEERIIAMALIEGIDEQGYLRESLEEVAARLGTSAQRVEAILKVIHTFEPSGIGARDLAECLAIQLREQDRFDPAMEALIKNLPLLARREFATLRRICGVDDEDLSDMIGEIRRLNPRPGAAFDAESSHPVLPDVLVQPAQDGGWRVELNTEVLPRVLVNQAYVAQVSASPKDDAGKAFVANCLQSANWLTKSLEQRARTILKVASEIVRQQDGFLTHGVEHLRPLNLKTVAEAIGMHESTVSRVTSNKFMATPRGLYEMKYFFTAAIAAERGGPSHSAESVRHRIKQMIDQEAPDAVLSDDAIVALLKAANIDIARRTVAKYRESLRLPSSVERRREKSSSQRLG